MSFQSCPFIIGLLSSSPRHQPLLQSCPGCWHFIFVHVTLHACHGAQAGDSGSQSRISAGFTVLQLRGLGQWLPLRAWLAPTLKWRSTESLLHRSWGGRISWNNACRCLELNAQKLSVMFINEGWITLALLQVVTTALGQNYPMEYSVMSDTFNCELSNMEGTN